MLEDLQSHLNKIDPEDQIKTLEIQLLPDLKNKAISSHEWILITTIKHKDRVLDIGTRHKNYHLLDAIKAHYIFIKHKFKVDLTHRFDKSFYLWHIIPQALKSRDLEDLKAASEEGANSFIKEYIGTKPIIHKNDKINSPL